MVAWLIPVCLFALFASLFLGGTQIEPRGGSNLRQLLGLLASCAVHVGLWNVLHMILGGVGPVASIVFASLLMIPGVLLSSFIGFLIFGVKLGRAAPAH